MNSRVQVIDVSNYIEWWKVSDDYYPDGKTFHRDDGVWLGNPTRDITFRAYVNGNMDAAQEYWTTGLQPELYGFASDPVTVTVNGVLVSLNNTSFSASVTLSEGNNTIAARVDQGSNTASDSINITFTSNGSITGTVTSSSTGLPVESATVSITDSLNNTQNTLTAADGSYTITGIEPGAFSGSIAKIGYETYNFSGTITSGQTITVNAALNPSSPVISNISVTNISTDSATITWTTDQEADSLVDYGVTAAYGSSTPDAAMVTSHSITLNDLNPGTLHHFKVTSTAASELSSSSGDNTFTTLSTITITIVFLRRCR